MTSDNCVDHSSQFRFKSFYLIQAITRPMNGECEVLDVRREACEGNEDLVTKLPNFLVVEPMQRYDAKKQNGCRRDDSMSGYEPDSIDLGKTLGRVPCR